MGNVLAPFWYETLRCLGHTAYGGADIGEVLTTAQRIAPGDYDSWHDEWLHTAERVSIEANAAQSTGHSISARDGLLRASTYYRTAEFFLHGNPDDPRIAYAYKRSVACFKDAIALFDLQIEPVEIPYEGTVLHGYFYHAKGNGPHPTMLMHNGFDGTAEEMHFNGAFAGVERGYHVLTFDGPGQPAARHREGLVFRPDWEHVVTPVLGWLLTRSEVGAAHVGLLGVSLGGELALRAAAFERRLTACVAVDGVYDVGLAVVANFSGSRDEIEHQLRAEHAPEMDRAIDAAMESNPTVRWVITHGTYVMGTPTPRAFLAAYLDYHLRDGIAEAITCPTLVCDAEDGLFFKGQPQLLYDHLACAKTLLHMKDSEGAGAHCHTGAQRLAYARIYDWLDGVLKPSRLSHASA